MNSPRFDAFRRIARDEAAEARHYAEVEAFQNQQDVYWHKRWDLEDVLGDLLDSSDALVKHIAKDIADKGLEAGARFRVQIQREGKVVAQLEGTVNANLTFAADSGIREAAAGGTASAQAAIDPTSTSIGWDAPSVRQDVRDEPGWWGISNYFRIVVGSEAEGNRVFFRQYVRGGYTSDAESLSVHVPWRIDSSDSDGRYGFDAQGRADPGLTGVERQWVYSDQSFQWVRWITDSPAVNTFARPIVRPYYRSEFITYAYRQTDGAEVAIDRIRWGYIVDRSGNVTPFEPERLGIGWP